MTKFNAKTKYGVKVKLNEDDVNAVFTVLNSYCGLSRETILLNGPQYRYIIGVRHIGIYLTLVKLEATTRAAGEIFKAGQHTVRYARNHIEELREDAVFNSFIEDMEQALTRLRKGGRLLKKSKLPVDNQGRPEYLY